ncbi:hypothetical protein BD626DRAFT_483718 [Schizophyllum amplum]|uniref:Uncharacterized protein n=1 Tax=Schizophyllum amplum TaxID=97359 RepID=A0A550CPN8_9AGAR|nr:hypothetical protein BD626DRAFT_483718 [Auriculariopsis ampla]
MGCPKIATSQRPSPPKRHQSLSKHAASPAATLSTARAPLPLLPLVNAPHRLDLPGHHSQPLQPAMTASIRSRPLSQPPLVSSAPFTHAAPWNPSAVPRLYANRHAATRAIHRSPSARNRPLEHPAHLSTTYGSTRATLPVRTTDRSLTHPSAPR